MHCTGSFTDPALSESTPQATLSFKAYVNNIPHKLGIVKCFMQIKKGTEQLFP